MEEYREYEGIGSGDVDIDKRVVRTLQQLSKEPSESNQKSCGDIHQAKAVYRMLSNGKFKGEQVRKVSAEESVMRMEASKAEVVLVVQDSSALNYTNLRETEGFGRISSNKKSKGIILHNALGVGVDDEIYGLLGQEIIVRSEPDESKTPKRKIEEKESNKWLKMMEETEKLLPAGVMGVHVSDREGDIYEYFERCEQIGSKYLCRRTHERKIDSGSRVLAQYIDGLPEVGELVLKVPRDSHTKRQAREAKLSVKFGAAEIVRPVNVPKAAENGLEKVRVYVISAVEKDAPQDGSEPICWQLITNIAINSFGEAVQKINWYTKRWRVEDFHYTLKSGCSIEKRQASSETKIEKLIALYSVIAIGIMIMTWFSRVNPDVSCEVLFTEDEWKILYCVAKKTQFPPETPPSVYEAVRFVAILGGFPARKSDGEPGVKSIWMGLSQFRTILFAKQFC